MLECFLLLHRDSARWLPLVAIPAVVVGGVASLCLILSGIEGLIKEARLQKRKAGNQPASSAPCHGGISPPDCKRFQAGCQRSRLCILVVFQDGSPQACFQRGRSCLLLLCQDRITAGDALVANTDEVVRRI